MKKKEKMINEGTTPNINITANELKVWIEAGLLNKDLLMPEKQKQLFDFVSANKSTLYGYFHENRDEFNFFVNIPSANELANTLELEVINKTTGKIAILEQITFFELIGNINLKIRTCELNDWQKIKEQLNNLTKEQKPIFLQEFSEMVATSRGEVLKSNLQTLIDQIISKKRKPTKIRHAGHFTDSKLRHDLIAEPFPTTLKKINDQNVTIKAFGIKLTPAEDKLMNAIYKILHDKSECKNITSDLFYSGNIQGLEGTTYTYGTDTVKSAVIRIKPIELYNEYLGKNEHSGKEITNIKNTLFALCDKKFLIQYNRKRIVKNQPLTDRIEDVQPLLRVLSYFEGMTDSEIKKLDNGDNTIRNTRGELIIALNPLLTDQIASKYVEYPEDINQRTAIAAGGALRVTVSVIALRDYLLRELSAKRITCTLSENTLIKQLGLNNYVSKGHKKRVIQRINVAIESSKRMGLILDIKKDIGAQNQTIYIFILNENFY